MLLSVTPSDIVIVVKDLSKVFYWLPGRKRTTTRDEELVKFIGVPVKPAAILLLANKGIQSIINPPRRTNKTFNKYCLCCETNVCLFVNVITSALAHEAFVCQRA